MSDLSAVRIDAHPEGGSLIHVKAVPGSSRDALAGALGDRLKVRISAPAEGGRANKAIAALLADALGVRAGDVEVASGRSSPEKAIRVASLSPEVVRDRLVG